MFVLNQASYFIFRDDTGLTSSDYTIVFLRNGVTCSDALTLNEFNNLGLYVANYTPTALGQDYLEFTNNHNNQRFICSERVEESSSGSSGGITISSNVVALTQNYGGPNNLKPFISNPTSFTLYIFKSSDWLIGNRSPGYSVGQTELDSSGNWITSTINVIPDTYNVVTLDSNSNFYIIKANMQVT